MITAVKMGLIRCTVPILLVVDPLFAPSNNCIQIITVIDADYLLRCRFLVSFTAGSALGYQITLSPPPPVLAPGSGGVIVGAQPARL